MIEGGSRTPSGSTRWPSPRSAMFGGGWPRAVPPLRFRVSKWSRGSRRGFVVIRTGTPSEVSASLSWKCPWRSTEVRRPAPGCRRCSVRPDRSAKISSRRCTRSRQPFEEHGGGRWTPWWHQRPSDRRMAPRWSDGSTAYGCRSMTPHSASARHRPGAAGAAVRTFDPRPRPADDGILADRGQAGTIRGGRSCSGIYGGSSPARGTRRSTGTSAHPRVDVRRMSSVLGAEQPPGRVRR